MYESERNEHTSKTTTNKNLGLIDRLKIDLLALSMRFKIY